MKFRKAERESASTFGNGARQCLNKPRNMRSHVATYLTCENQMRANDIMSLVLTKHQSLALGQHEKLS